MIRKTQRLPTRDEFVAFWEHPKTLAKLAPLVLSFVGLGLAGGASLLIGRHFGRFALPAYMAAIAFVLFAPIAALLTYWKRFDRFIRCPKCRDWVGQDSSGAYSGPNPKWIRISETGYCGKCGALMVNLGERKPELTNGAEENVSSG